MDTFDTRNARYVMTVLGRKAPSTVNRLLQNKC